MISAERRRIIVSGVAFVPLLVLAVGWTLGLRVNLSPSYPLGLWHIQARDHDVRVGDLIFICPPMTATFEKAYERGYIRRGLCPGWRSPLIKTVVALPGQMIGIRTSVTVDGRPLPGSELRSIDGAGRPLMPFSGGIVPAGSLFSPLTLQRVL